MGKTETQDVDRTLKTVLVRTVSTLVTKQENKTDPRRALLLFCYHSLLSAFE